MDNNETNVLLKKSDKNLTIILLSFLVVLTIAFLSKQALYIQKIQDEHRLLSEFCENQEIFHKYFNQKRELYAELNLVAWDSSGEVQSKGDLRKYSLSLALFSGIRGPWGWDESRLDNQYSFKQIIEDAFIFDFLYWSKRYWETEKLTNASGKLLPDSLIREFYDMEKRLFSVIRNKDFIRKFFEKNLEIKVSFFKDMLQKYEISFPDSLSFKNQTKLSSSQLSHSFSEFLNDSIRHTFYLNTLYQTIGMGHDFYSANETYESICINIFDNYIREKFKVYDEEIFSNKLPYLAYVDKMQRKKLQYEKIIDNSSNIPLKVEPPFFKYEINMVLFYKSLFWILVVLGFFLKNIFLYHDKIYKELKINSSKGVLNKKQYPYLINILVLNFTNKTLALKIISLLVQLMVTLIVVFGIVIQYFDIIYENAWSFIFFWIVPILILIYLDIEMLKKKAA